MSEQDNTETFPSANNEHLHESKAHVMQAADELRAAATEKAQQIRTAAGDRAKSVRSQAESAAERLKTAALDGKQRFSQFADDKMNVTKDRARQYHEEGEQYVRENPSKAILTALGVGFVIGALFAAKYNSQAASLKPRPPSPVGVAFLSPMCQETLP